MPINVENVPANNYRPGFQAIYNSSGVLLMDPNTTGESLAADVEWHFGCAACKLAGSCVIPKETAVDAIGKYDEAGIVGISVADNCSSKLPLSKS